MSVRVHSSRLEPTSKQGGFPPLHLACQKGDHKDVKRLCNSNNVNQLDFIGFPPLMYAYHCFLVSHGDSKATEIVKMLLRKGATMNAYLLKAFEDGQDELSKLFVDHGERVDGYLLGSRIPIFLAVNFKNIETVKYLFSKGMDVFMSLEDGDNIFEYLLKNFNDFQNPQFVVKFFMACMEQANRRDSKKFKAYFTKAFKSFGENKENLSFKITSDLLKLIILDRKA